jgi:hypothetical protein
LKHFQRKRLEIRGFSEVTRLFEDIFNEVSGIARLLKYIFSGTFQMSGFLKKSKVFLIPLKKNRGFSFNVRHSERI